MRMILLSIFILCTFCLIQSETLVQIDEQLIDSPDSRIDFDEVIDIDATVFDEVIDNYSDVTEEASWEHVTSLSELDADHALDVLKHVPLKSVWDAKRRVYRLTVDFDHLESKYSDPASEDDILDNVDVSNEVNDDDNTNDTKSKALSALSHIQTQSTHVKTASTPTVDHDKLFTLLISAVKNMTIITDTLIDHVELVEAEKAAFALAIVRYTEEIKVDYKHATAAELKQHRIISEINTELAKIQELLSVEDGRQKKEAAEYKLQMRQDMRSTHEYSLFNHTEMHSIKSLDIVKNRVSRLRGEYTQQDQAHYDFESSQVETETTMELSAITSDTQIAVKGILYRKQVEAEVELDNFDIFMKLTNAQAEASMQTFDAMVRVVVERIGDLSHGMFHDVTRVYYTILIIVIILSVIILAMESGTVMRTAIINLFQRRQIVSKHVSGDGSLFTKTTNLKSIFLNPDSHERLVNYMLQLRRAAQDDMVLPNLIITGPPGVGKTLAAAVAIFDGSSVSSSGGDNNNNNNDTTTTESNTQPSDFESLNKPVSLVCGGDLLAQGMQAALYLRNVLEKAETSGCMVVLDGLDDVVRRRTSIGHSVYRDCLCALLYSLKTGSTRYGVIITCSGDVCDVDPAVLDRMDTVLTLQAPSSSSRYDYCRSLTLDRLSSYMTHGNLLWLDSIRSIKSIQEINIGVNGLLEEMSPEDTANSVANNKKKKSVKPLKKKAVSSSSSISISSSSGGSNPSSPKGNNLDIEYCLFRMVAKTEGYSYRELSKIFKNIENALLATEDCRLSNQHIIDALI